MHVTPDEVVFWRHGWISLNLTIVTTWGVMALLTVGSWLVTRRLSAELRVARWQSLLEIVLQGIRDQIREAGLSPAERYLPFIGTLFLLLAGSALLTVLPGYESPSSSLSTTTALALAVFLAVPFFGVSAVGWRGYLSHFLEPSPILLPFNLLSDVSRTLALAIRLFGNAMSGSMILAILLSIAPFFFPVLMSLLELLTGVVQAYIFAVLATVYVAAASQQAEGSRKGGSHD